MKSFKKRALALLVVMCMLCTSMVTVAVAADTTILEVDVEISGDEAYVTVLIPSSSKAASASITITYDTSYMTLTAYDYGDIKGLVSLNNCLYGYCGEDDVTEVDVAAAGELIISFAASRNQSGTLMTATFSLDKGTFDESYLGLSRYKLASATSGTIEELTTSTELNVVVDCDYSKTYTEVTETTCGKSGTGTTTIISSSNNDAVDEGDANYTLVALFAIVALAGCVVAKKKATC